MKNNKGVTLVELLIVIVVMGIIAAFAIPAVGSIITNTQKDAILADALAVENAANLYCASTTCTASQTLSWNDISQYVEGLDASYYTFGADGTITVATKSSGDWSVNLQAATTGDWEVTNLVPSNSDRDDLNAAE